MSEFAATHVRCTATLRLDAPPDAAFALFGPVHEAEWAEGWQITVMHATTPMLEEEGAVFTTHLHGDHPTVWVITRYDAAHHRLQYARITPAMQAAMIDIECCASDAGTQATVTYTLTGLSEAGNQRIDAFAAHYESMMEMWQRAINHRIHTGERLPHHV